MRILIEGAHYREQQVRHIVEGLDVLEAKEGEVRVPYVGYYYNVRLRDCVFILPKVLMDERERVFGKYRPEDLLSLSEDKGPLTSEERQFIYRFAVWIYRAIVVFRHSRPEEAAEVVSHQRIALPGAGSKRKTNTFLDILIALVRFAEDNNPFFFTILKNQHSGFRKIHWPRTIAHTPALIAQGTPFYPQPVNRRRVVNFDEELLVIFFSILHYVADTYGFPRPQCPAMTIIKGRQFDRYLNGWGTRRLRQIKYKYFSDKALELWHLCYAFFDEAAQVAVRQGRREYLLAKNFYTVFEAIIDDLIGDHPLPDGMTRKQADGRIVDHLFTAQSLVERRGGKRRTYYIGDSKYYAIGNRVEGEALEKQFSYARNVIQWNLNIFNEGRTTTSGIRLRDELTEGYDIIPNFFISARLGGGNRLFDYADDNITPHQSEGGPKQRRWQFPNRLFDRDTLLLYHYDVNFLFVLKLYARNHSAEKKEWKEKVGRRFTEDIRAWLQEDYDFYAMRAKVAGQDRKFLKNNFRSLLGKTLRPYTTPEGQPQDDLFALALDKQEEDQNKVLLNQLGKVFHVQKCPLGDPPRLPASLQPVVTTTPQPMVMLAFVPQSDSAYWDAFTHGQATLYYAGRRFPAGVPLKSIKYVVPVLKGMGMRFVYEVTDLSVRKREDLVALGAPVAKGDDLRLCFGLANPRPLKVLKSGEWMPLISQSAEALELNSKGVKIISLDELDTRCRRYAQDEERQKGSTA